jgi:hypothetical protein
LPYPLIAYDTNSPAEIKKALNRLEVPYYNGQIGTWTIDQVRRSMNPGRGNDSFHIVQYGYNY